MELRFCDDIGMFAWDRPIDNVYDTKGKLLASGSCIHATEWCKPNCYNEKLYKLYPNMRTKDIRNESQWQNVTGREIKAILSRKKKPTKRARGCTRGENIKDYEDIERWVDIATENPDTDFWVPIRGWRDIFLRKEIERVLFPISNLAILASTDVTTTEKEWQELKEAGWSTMYVGDDELENTPLGERMFKCPKTFKKLKGHCGICKAGCFKSITLGQAVDVHLSQH